MRLLESIAEDVRFAFRMMRRSPGLTAVAVLSLALGIGATTAIFSVMYALALRTLPVQQPDRLAAVGQVDGENRHTYAEWKLFQDRQDIFTGVAAYNWADTTFYIGHPEEQLKVSGFYVSRAYFQTLGVSAALGRALEPSDDQPGAPPVCVIGYGLWRRLYDRSQDIIGRLLQVNGHEFQIVGVLPQSFFGVDVGVRPEIFMPLETERAFRDYQKIYGHQTPSLDNSQAELLSIIGRLKPGVSVSQANAGLRVLYSEIYRVLSPRSRDRNERSAQPTSPVARPIPNGVADIWLGEINVVLLLMSMAVLALVIACANLGNLLLARATKRQAEIATRLALGATRGRLVRQLLTESIAISVVGAAAGLIIARWGRAVLVWALSYPREPLRLNLYWDARLVIFAVGITLSCALLFGLAPAIHATHGSLYSAMNNSGTTARGRNRVSNSILIVVQVALSMALLVSAGLLARTLRALLAQDPGYDPKGVLMAQARRPGPGESPQREAFVGKELLAEFRSLPGVISASWSRPFSGMTLSRVVVPGPRGSERRSAAYLIFISPDFFKTQRTPILAGRDFNNRDGDTSFPVAVLSEELAKTLFRDANPIGTRFRENDQNGSGEYHPVEVVGIAKDIQYRRPSDAALPILFRPVSQCGTSCSGIGSYEIRVAGALPEMARRLKNSAAIVDSHVVLKFQPLSDMVDNSVHQNRAMALIAMTFGLFVGLLAMIGVYGMTSYSTAERTREIGIRMALGATPGNVFRMILRETMMVVCIGIAFGVGAGFAAARMIRWMLWEVRPTDPFSFGFAICLMLLITGIAAFLSARRAAKADPMIALRFE